MSSGIIDIHSTFVLSYMSWTRGFTSLQALELPYVIAIAELGDGWASRTLLSIASLSK